MTSLDSIVSPAWPGAASDAATPVVLLLHGYGSNEQDLPSLAPSLPAGTQWASLRAPIEMGFGGAMWFPLNPPAEPDHAAIAAATEAVWAWVHANVPAAAPVVPMGFSQGGLMALELLRTRPERVAATVVLAGFTTNATGPADAVLATARPRVFWGHGTDDWVVWPEAIERMHAWLPEHSTLTERVYAGLAHGINGPEMNDVREFLVAALAPQGV
jgi:phospholipase/carboxylesterase